MLTCKIHYLLCSTENSVTSERSANFKNFGNHYCRSLHDLKILDIALNKSPEILLALGGGL